MAKQHGNSGRGPEQLDAALGLDEDVDFRDRDVGSYRGAGMRNADGDAEIPEGGATASSAPPALSEGELIGPWDEEEAEGLKAAEEGPGGSVEKGKEYGANAGLHLSGGERPDDGMNADAQPGGGVHSESERPDDPERRWGSNRGK